MIDAQGTTITFDGTAIGGLDAFEFTDGQAGAQQEAVFRGVNAEAAVALPGLPDHGKLILKMYRDTADAGQIKLQTSRRSRQVKQCIITHKNGATETFNAFCLSLPAAGSKSQSKPVLTSTCVLRISGPIT